MSTRVAGRVRELVDATGIASITADIARYVAAQRWSGGRGGGVTDIEFVDAATVIETECTVVFTVIRTQLDDHREIRYALPIGLRALGDPLAERAPAFLIGEVHTEQRDAFAYDAVGDPEYVRWIWSAMRDGTTVATDSATLRFGTSQPDALQGEAEPEVRWLSAEQSNTSVVLDDRVFLKHLRRIEDGPSHELEMARALAAAGFAHLAPILATGEYAPHGEHACLLALAQPYLRNASEGWALALISLRGLFADAEESDLRDAVQRHEAVDDQGGAFIAEAARLGDVVAEMHRALASDSLPPDMRPEPLTSERLSVWADGMLAELDSLLQRPEEVLAPLRAARDGIAAHFESLRSIAPRGLRTRIHGDLHLGQVLRTDQGWFILDFEGEPNRAPSARRERSSPLRDVAGMLRSFDYAAAAALDERADLSAPEADSLRALGERWSQVNRDAFWAAYLAGMDGTGVLGEQGATLTLRRAFEVQKAVYELGYELGHRPGWAPIPLSFLLRGVA